MNLESLAVSGDRTLDRRIRDASNYCDSGHLFRMTSGIARLVLSELSPIDLDGHRDFTVIANVEQPLSGKPGYNRDSFFKVSFYNLDRKTSQALYQFRKPDEAFCLYAAGLLLDVLAEADQASGGKNHLPAGGDPEPSPGLRLPKGHPVKIILKSQPEPEVQGAGVPLLGCPGRRGPPGRFNSPLLWGNTGLQVDDGAAQHRLSGKPHFSDLLEGGALPPDSGEAGASDRRLH